MNIILTFTILTAINVILSTVKSLVTIKGGAFSSSIVNGLYYGFYNILIIYTVADFSVAIKCVITFACNVIGVYLVKTIECKLQKDKLWKIEITVPTCQYRELDKELKTIPHSYLIISSKHTLFNIYTDSQEKSREVRKLVDKYNAKWFVSECKNLYS